MNKEEIKKEAERLYSRCWDMLWDKTVMVIDYEIEEQCKSFCLICIDEIIEAIDNIGDEIVLDNIQTEILNKLRYYDKVKEYIEQNY